MEEFSMLSCTERDLYGFFCCYYCWPVPLPSGKESLMAETLTKADRNIVRLGIVSMCIFCLFVFPFSLALQYHVRQLFVLLLPLPMETSTC